MSSQQTAAETVPKRIDSKKPTPWRWSQRWRHVFFAHLQAPAAQLRPHVPSGLEIDTFEGKSWITLVAFRLEKVRLRRLPPIGPCSNFLELNLRTYVRLHGEPAIYFLSIHANNRWAVRLARWLTPLPYQFARMTYDQQGPDWRFECHHDKHAGAPLLFRSEFRPMDGPHQVRGHSLDAWLLERYAALVEGKVGRMHRLVVQHRPWQVQDVVLQSAASDLDRPWGLNLQRKPDRCHFAEQVDALLWPFEPIAVGEG